MDYLKNHCWCSDSNWGGNYNCQIIVGLNSYAEGYKEDWVNVMTIKEYFSPQDYEEDLKLLKETSDLSDKKCCTLAKRMATQNVNTLRPEVYDWLSENVPDDNKGNKMWCVGSDDYAKDDSSISYCIFFQRRKDAMNFIKTWSKWKKPIRYTQYFTDVRKTLDLQTLKYNVSK